MKTSSHIYLLLITSALLLGVTSCAVTDIDRTANFNNYKTFSWGTVETNASNPLYKGDLIDRRIKNAIENEFNKRGINRTDNNPDFVVNYQTYTETKQESFNNYSMFYRPFMPFSYGYGYGYYPYGFGMYPGYGYGWPGYSRNYTYTKGTLVIDIVDARTKEEVWRGSVSGNVDNIGNLQKQIQKGIKAIMKKYPTPTHQQLQLPNAIS